MANNYRAELRDMILKQANGDYVAAYAERFAKQFRLPLSSSVSLLEEARDENLRYWRVNSVGSASGTPICVKDSFLQDDFSFLFLMSEQSVEIENTDGQTGLVLSGGLSIDLPSASNQVFYEAGDVVAVLPCDGRVVFRCGVGESALVVLRVK